jgi:hypothetical protein
MNACTAPRGIFSLRPCGADASDTCSACGKPLCQEHVLYRSAQVFCSKCGAQGSADEPTARENKGRPGAPSGRTNATGTVGDQIPEWDRPGWADRYRTNYYASSSYHPVVFYDDYDRRSFDERADLGGDDTPDGSAGFGDS